MIIYIPGIGFLDTMQFGLLIFFIGGLATTLHPCLFPILPLSILKMFNADTRNKTFKVTTVLITGQLLAFLVLALFITFIFSFLRVNFTFFNAIMGVLLVIIGIVLLIPSLTMKLNSLFPHHETNLNSSTIRYLDVFTLGLGYTLLASPCAGTTFAVLMIFISTIQDIVMIVLGFPFFAIGLALPYYILALSTTEFRMQISRWMTKKAQLVNSIMGGLVIIFGVGMILPLFGGSPWWETISWLPVVLGVLLIALLLVSLIAHFYRRWTQKTTDLKQQDEVIT